MGRPAIDAHDVAFKSLNLFRGEAADLRAHAPVIQAVSTALMRAPFFHDSARCLVVVSTVRDRDRSVDGSAAASCGLRCELDCMGCADGRESRPGAVRFLSEGHAVGASADAILFMAAMLDTQTGLVV